MDATVRPGANCRPDSGADDPDGPEDCDGENRATAVARREARQPDEAERQCDEYGEHEHRSRDGDSDRSHAADRVAQDPEAGPR